MHMVAADAAPLKFNVSDSSQANRQILGNQREHYKKIEAVVETLSYLTRPSLPLNDSIFFFFLLNTRPRYALYMPNRPLTLQVSF